MDSGCEAISLGRGSFATPYACGLSADIDGVDPGGLSGREILHRRRTAPIFLLAVKIASRGAQRGRVGCVTCYSTSTLGSFVVPFSRKNSLAPDVREI